MKKEIIQVPGFEMPVLPDGKPDSPAFLVFSNYEKILQWNRSLRFGISVCTLGNMIKKEI